MSEHPHPGTNGATPPLTDDEVKEARELINEARAFKTQSIKLLETSMATLQEVKNLRTDMEGWKKTFSGEVGRLYRVVQDTLSAIKPPPVTRRPPRRVKRTARSKG